MSKGYNHKQPVMTASEYVTRCIASPSQSHPGIRPFSTLVIFLCQIGIDRDVLMKAVETMKEDPDYIIDDRRNNLIRFFKFSRQCLLRIINVFI